MRLHVGGTARTTNCQIEYCWECGVESFNRKLDRDVATWIAQNEKVLNKSVPEKAAKILMDQFPDLSYVEVKDYAHRMAKGIR